MNDALKENRGFSSEPGNEKGTLLRKTAYIEIDLLLWTEWWGGQRGLQRNPLNKKGKQLLEIPQFMFSLG